MNRNTHPFFFLTGITAMGLVWLSSPFWLTGDPDPVRSENPKPEKVSRQLSGFQYSESGKAPYSAGPVAENVDRQKVQRQLQRRAHMEKSGMVKNVIENENMPEEVRSRFRAEKARLDALANQYPEWAAKEDGIPLPRQVDDNGDLDPKFKEAIAVMKSTGDWDKLHYDFLRKLEAAAADETLPAEERPTREFIDAFKAGGYIPSL